MRLVFLCLLAASVAGGVACTPSPERLCEHTVRVVEKQFGPDDPRSPNASHAAGVKRCTEVWAQKKKENAKAYECYANCAYEQRNIVDLASCQPKCYPNEKPRDETENLDGVFWKDDAGSAPSAAPSIKPSP
jgi:hypothetical protein